MGEARDFSGTSRHRRYGASYVGRVAAFGGTVDAGRQDGATSSTLLALRETELEARHCETVYHAEYATSTPVGDAS